MTIIKKKVYLHHIVDGDTASYAIRDQDFSVLDQYTLLSVQEVEFDIGDFDGREKEIDIVEKALEQVRAESQSRINILIDRLSKLKAIGHDSEVVN